MSSTGAMSNHINHVETQLPYALTVAAVSFVGYILAGFIQSAWIVLPLSLVMIFGVLYIIKLSQGKKGSVSLTQ
jgi:Na+/H+ antiporter NhaC